MASKRNSKSFAHDAAANFASLKQQILTTHTDKIPKKSGKDKRSQMDGKLQGKHAQQHGGDDDDDPETIEPHSKPLSNNRGIKRDARGEAKYPSHGTYKSQNTKIQEYANSKHDQAILLQEIEALGGSKHDLDLVVDALSDEGSVEMHERATSPDGALQRDLVQFAAGLGFEAVSDDDHIVESDSELEQDDLVEEEAPEKPNMFESFRTENRMPPGGLIFDPRPDWHAEPLSKLPSQDGADMALHKTSINNLKQYAAGLLDSDNNIYSSKYVSTSSSHRFLSSIMSSGTLSDKVSALTLVVQESPLHSRKALESLLALAKKRSRGQAITALGALKDLLGAGAVLPAERRLRPFASQPGLLGSLKANSVSNWRFGQNLPGNITKKHLIFWVYEDWLKDFYFDLLKVLESWCNDEVIFARSQAVTYVFELLKEKPEGESNLLRLLVNKLGDPEKKIASRASYLLLQLQTFHPLMKAVIVHSIESEIILRPGQSAHAKYYAINTLNQTILSVKEEDIARKLLGLYFGLFVSLLKRRDFNSTSPGKGINQKGSLKGDAQRMGKKASPKVTQEEQAKEANDELTEKLISAVLTGVNRAHPFSGMDDSTLEKHMDTLFRITHSSNFNTSIQALMLIEQLATSKQIALGRFYRTLYESLLDPRLVMSSKHALYLNLLFRALKSDLNVVRVKAFVKRLLQVVVLHQPPFICGILYLVKELEKTFAGLKTLINEKEMDAVADEENFYDVDKGTYPEQQALPTAECLQYDGRKRNPAHSNADKSCLWEIMPLLSHYHPSVALFASRLLQDSDMPPKPDLTSHTLAHFLDRFVYRNAKAGSGGPRGSSIMQSLAGSDDQGVLLSNRPSRVQGTVNSEAFWRKKVGDVNVDDVFFHRYFSQIGKAKPSAVEKAVGPTGNGDENEEDEIWQALIQSRPGVEGNSEDESGLEMADLEGSDSESWADVAPTGDDTGFEPDMEEEIMEDLSEASSLLSDDDKASRAEEIATEVKTSHRKNKLKDLPGFAAVADYAHMIDGDGDEDEDEDVGYH